MFYTFVFCVLCFKWDFPCSGEVYVEYHGLCITFQRGSVFLREMSECFRVVHFGLGCVCRVSCICPAFIQESLLFPDGFC